jgi:hypothetical protein
VVYVYVLAHAPRPPVEALIETAGCAEPRVMSRRHEAA